MKENIFKRKPLTMYFLLSFAITWLILSPGVANTLGIIDFKFDGVKLFTISTIGPLLAAFIITALTKGKAGVLNMVKSILNLRVKLKWWMAAILLFFGLFVLSALIIKISGGPTLIIGNTISLIILVLGLLAASFGEETGWRGFVLPRLQQLYGPFKATIILSLFWWLWHLPVYWVMAPAIEFAQQVGIFVAFGLFQLIICLFSGVLYTWIYNGSRGSILMPVLLHTSWNFWSLAFPGQMASSLVLPFYLITAIIIAVVTKGKLGLEKRISKI